MSGPETRLWEAFRPHLVDMRLDPQRVENVLSTGTPDVNTIPGWIELKHVDCWPKRPTTSVDVGVRPEQAAWLIRRWSCGGLCWLVVRVERQIFLFSGWDALMVRHGLPTEQFKEAAVWRSDERGTLNTLQKADLLKWLNGDANAMTPGNRAKFHRLRCMKSLQQVADEIDWDLDSVKRAERADDYTTDDLLSFWEN